MLLDRVVVALGGREDVHDDGTEVEQHPVRDRETLASDRPELLAPEAFEDPVRDRVQLALRTAGADHEIVGERRNAGEIQKDDFGSLLGFGGSYGKQQFWSAKTFERMLPAPLTLAADAKPRSFGIGLDGKPERFGHGAASAATFSVDRGDNLVVVMTRNKMGKNQEKYNGKFWDAIRQGIDKK